METLSYTSVFLSVLAVSIGTLYVYFKHKFNYWRKRKVMQLKPSFPFGDCADLALMRKSVGEAYGKQYKLFEGHKFGGIYLTIRPQLLIRDPEFIKNILVKDFDHFHNNTFIFDETFDPLTGNLLMLNGQKWKDLRVKLSPTYTSGKMKMMFPILVDCGAELREYLEKFTDKGDMLEMREVFAKFSTDVIASCAFGIQCNCLKNPDAEFRKRGKRVTEPSFDTILRSILYTLVPSIATTLRIPSTPNDITNFFRKVVQETVAFREAHSVERNDFMQMLIKLKNKETLDPESSSTQQNEKSAGMTMDRIAAQMFLFFVAGFETSSTTMSYCLHELAVDPGIQQHLREEVDRVLQRHGGVITYEAIQEMEYLDKVVSETLRKYPPVGIVSRKCTKDYRIPGSEVTVEKGTDIIIPVEGLHQDPQYYPEPDRFDPERFSEDVKNSRHHYVYLPFGEGPRICIGMRFGLMQTKVGLVSVLSKYEFSVCSKTSLPLKRNPKQFISSPLNGIWLQIRNKSDNEIA